MDKTECFRLIPPVAVGSVAATWAAEFPQFDCVVGYSDLGHVFLASAAGEYAVLHPFKAAAKSYGTFSGPGEFADTVLRDPGFAEYVMLPGHVAEIRALLGPLGDGQVYIPTPYPFLGGSMEPTTYTVGDVWTFLDLVAEAHGHNTADRTPTLIRPADEKVAVALEEWAWIGVDGKRPVFTTLFGDVFLGDEDGVWLLDIISGTLTRRWASFQECETALNDPSQGPQVLRADLVAELVDRGITSAADQVYDFSHPPVLGGAMTADNVEVLDFVVAVGIAGQVHEQARFVPEGARVSVEVAPRRSGWRKLFGRR
ncbi:hypothetical protein AB0I35_09805 [Nocardia sp. NPDC050378]|uniref:hypothetical protein n=1 Tax=Nocardia sp. NPDC050378 TaxID=3155400 RepID=UPI0033C2EEDA